MELMMFIGNDCIDAIIIEPSFIVFPGYVGSFIRLLKRKHEHLLCKISFEPEFLLHNIPVKEPKQAIQITAYSEIENIDALKQTG